MNPKLLRYAIVPACAVLLSASQIVEAGCYDKRSPGMDWNGCKKINKMLDEIDFTGASLVKTDLSRSSATASHFQNADLTKAVGYRAKFDRVKLLQSTLTKSEFSRASFKNAQIENVDWSKSELGRADFSGAQLKNVSFIFTNLSRVNFSNAELSEVDIKGAYTYLARFQGVDLRGVKNLSQIQLDLACGDADTRLPEGSWMPDTWPCPE
ncbi:MAG: pentapeptide repeat-containing protein [Gammaproteobacteria bacterium]|nr:pentapeptide repeat-containing protein [Gammaproteobacteria bacterium]